MAELSNSIELKEVNSRKRSGDDTQQDDSSEDSKPQKPRTMTVLSSWRAAAVSDRVFVLVGICICLCLFGEGVRRSAIWREEWRKGRMTIQGMSPGWMFGLPQDLSDTQWRTLRKFFPILVAGLCVHVSISSVVRRLEEKRPGSRSQFYAFTGVIFVFVLHGRGAVWNLLASVSCFVVGKVFRHSPWNLILTWAICLWVKWASDYYRGFESTRFAPFLGQFGRLMDGQRGLYAWQIQFNLTLLRLISFNTELFWSLRRDAAPAHELPALKSNGKDNIQRQDNLSSSEFDFVSFLGYVYYIPLYIAGPICRYPQWIDQVKRPKTVISVKTFAERFLWVAGHVLLVELILHLYIYVSVNNNRTWRQIQGRVMPGWEVAFGGYLTLQFMYVKFTAIWRFFRLWSLLDAIHAPENMNRCVNMNYTFEGFWRQWHASLNQWIVRYMYLPFGGKQAQWWSMWVIFTFVGLWHDLMWRWLAWAWLNCVFFSFETAVVRLTRHPTLDAPKQQNPLVWALVVNVCCALNQVLLIIANLAIMHGFQGSLDFFRNIFLTRSGEVSASAGVVAVCIVLFFMMMVHVNVLLRRVEAAHGIHKRF